MPNFIPANALSPTEIKALIAKEVVLCKRCYLTQYTRTECTITKEKNGIHAICPICSWEAWNINFAVYYLLHDWQMTQPATYPTTLQASVLPEEIRDLFQIFRKVEDSFIGIHDYFDHVEFKGIDKITYPIAKAIYEFLDTFSLQHWMNLDETWITIEIENIKNTLSYIVLEGQNYNKEDQYNFCHLIEYAFHPIFESKFHQIYESTTHQVNMKKINPLTGAILNE